MFSFFKKIFSNTKQDEQEHVELEAPDTAPPVPVPEFDYAARVPDGWGIYISFKDFDFIPVTSYGQIRWALEEIQELAAKDEQAFVQISNEDIPDGCGYAQTLCFKPAKRGPEKGIFYYRNEVQYTPEGCYLYGEPTKKGDSSGGAKIDDTALILCTFIRDGGKLPEFPHLVGTYEKY